MMPTDFVCAERSNRAAAWGKTDEFLRARLSVMPALEASLARSRRALLALDIDGIERGTREQASLIRELEAAQQPDMAPPADTQGHAAAYGGTVPPVCSAELVEELRRREIRIREGARLQAALLARVRYKLCILGNMLAGLSITYGPQSAQNGAQAGCFSQAAKGRI
jgi:hypothetical protein